MLRKGGDREKGDSVCKVRDSVFHADRRFIHGSRRPDHRIELIQISRQRSVVGSKADVRLVQAPWTDAASYAGGTGRWWSRERRPSRSASDAWEETDQWNRSAQTPGTVQFWRPFWLPQYEQRDPAGLHWPSRRRVQDDGATVRVPRGDWVVEEHQKTWPQRWPSWPTDGRPTGLSISSILLHGYPLSDLMWPSNIFKILVVTI